MANEEHVAILKQGAEVWHKWRKENPDVRPELSRANLSGASLSGISFDEAELSGANLIGANLTDANLLDADLTLADLVDAELSGAILYEANLFRANLSGANLLHANLYDTVLASVDLSQAKNLDEVLHGGPSIIDHRTLQRSGPLPPDFLRGVGLSDLEIEVAKLYGRDLGNDQITDITYEIARIRSEQPIQFYSCFISFSFKDDEFAHRLYADLQDEGIRCWFAPHDMPIGARVRDTLDVLVRTHDKLLVILSGNSIESDWVEEEVEIAFEEERNSKDRRTILFPIRLDDAVCETKLAWARKLRRERSIGSFTDWKNRDTYQQAFQRLLHDLRVARQAPVAE